MNPSPELTIGALHVRAVDVPVRRPLETSGGVLSTAPLVLIDLHTEEGIIGSSYVFCYTSMALKPIAQLLSNLAPAIEGDPPSLRCISS